MMVHELLPSEFEQYLKPIFDCLKTEIRDPDWKVDWDYFLTTWSSWTAIGFARTWASEGAAAGGVFTNDLFSGAPRASLMFWAATPEARKSGKPIEVLTEFEKAAEIAGAKVAVAVHRAISPNKLAFTYMKRGYRLGEMIFVK